MNNREYLFLLKKIYKLLKIKADLNSIKYKDILGAPAVDIDIYARTDGYGYVDLGLPSGTIWADRNVGASSELDVGLYFLWGDIKGYGSGYSFKQSNYKYYSSSNYTKYNNEDNKTILDLEDDAVNAAMKGNWCTPSILLINELLNNTTYTQKKEGNNIIGTLLTSNINGKTLYIPNSGYRIGGGENNPNNLEKEEVGYLLSNELSSTTKESDYSSNYNIQYLRAEGGVLRISNNTSRYSGHPVRGVLNTLNLSLHKVALTGNFNDLENIPNYITEELLNYILSESPDLLAKLLEINELLTNDGNLSNIMEAISSKASIESLNVLSSDYNTFKSVVPNLYVSKSEFQETISQNVFTQYLTKEDFNNYLNPLKVEIISSSPTVVEYTGTPINIRIEYKVSKAGELVTPDVLKVDNNSIASNSTDTIYVLHNVLGNKKIVILATLGQETAKVEKTFNAVKPSYFGFDSLNVSTSNLTKVILSSISTSRTINNSVNGRYLWIVTPYTVNKVATDSGFAYIVDMILDKTQDGLNYYRSTLSIDICNLTYYIK